MKNHSYKCQKLQKSKGQLEVNAKFFRYPPFINNYLSFHFSANPDPNFRLDPDPYIGNEYGAKTLSFG